MTSMMLQRNAYAKVNWTLDILGKRADGYHLMDMVMQRVTLCDPMTFMLRHDGLITLKIAGSDLSADESNLVIRAAKALQQKTNCSLGADIQMEKRIPMGAGMGGGSADAAQTIHALCELWQLPMTLAEKYALGLTLGADVPYCLYGKPARVTGIGEGISPISMARSFPLVCIQPCRALSTKEAFHHYDNTPGLKKPDTEKAIEGFMKGDISAISAHCQNVMQPASQLLRPEMNTALLDLRSSGTFLAQMTGSGSVVFGAYDTQEQADKAYALLKIKYPVVFRTDTIL